MAKSGKYRWLNMGGNKYANPKSTTFCRRCNKPTGSIHKPLCLSCWKNFQNGNDKKFVQPINRGTPRIKNQEKITIRLWVLNHPSWRTISKEKKKYLNSFLFNFKDKENWDKLIKVYLERK